MQCANRVRRAVLLCLGLVASGCSESKPPSPPGPPTAVTVVRATPQLVRASTSFTGRIQATDKVDLRARVEGFLEKRQFVEGADVKQGDLLFVIEKGCTRPRSTRPRPVSPRRKQTSSSPKSNSSVKRSCSRAMSGHRRSSTK